MSGVLSVALGVVLRGLGGFALYTREYGAINDVSHEYNDEDPTGGLKRLETLVVIAVGSFLRLVGFSLLTPGIRLLVG